LNARRRLWAALHHEREPQAQQAVDDVDLFPAADLLPAI
jgi:hypothetical protein